jgi:hypothetical protein
LNELGDNRSTPETGPGWSSQESSPNCQKRRVILLCATTS